MYSDKIHLQHFIKLLDHHGQLIRIKSRIDPSYELAGIAGKLQGGPAILFEDVKGSPYPVITGIFGNRDNLGLMFGCSKNELPFVLDRAVQSWKSAPVEPVIIENAPAQEIILDRPNLYEVPTPSISLGDGGPYYTSSLVIAKDPKTKVRNASIHRIMVTGPDRMTLLLGTGGHLQNYFERSEAMGRPLEITISNGIDPFTFFACLMPASSVPIDRDELGIVSALMGRPMELCRSKTVGVEGVANAQLIIEGEILPGVREYEGPFGEVSGYYGPRDKRWTIQVKAMTMRSNPVISTMLPGVESYTALGLPTEAGLFYTVSNAVSGVKTVHMHNGGCGTYSAVIQMDPSRSGMAKNAVCAAFASHPSIQMVIVVNTDVDPYNADELMWAMCTRFRPGDDTVIIPNMASQRINPVSIDGCSHKIGFDCTVPIPAPEHYGRIQYMDVNLSEYNIVYPAGI